jgi:hypothetical protein
MLIWFGLILIAFNVVLRWRWRWIPGGVTALGVVIGGWLIAGEFADPEQRRLMLGVAIVFGGGVYLMALTGLALRAHLENQRGQSNKATHPGKGANMPSVRAARISHDKGV